MMRVLRYGNGICPTGPGVGNERETKLNLSLCKAERNLNVQGDVEGRNHVGYARV